MGRDVHDEADAILRRADFKGDDGLPEFEVRIISDETYYIRAPSAQRAVEAALASGEPDNENLEIKVIEVEYPDEDEGDEPSESGDEKEI